MGLLEPSEGELLIDEQLITGENRRAWQQRIAHVPQFIYLSDSSIGENIAFGIPKDEIDYHQVEKALEKSQLSKLIKEWKDGYETYVGERGARLSGGQRQRIGIARALYKNADVLVFDEATNSLDENTEKSIIDEILALRGKCTIFLVTHNKNLTVNCDEKYLVNNKNIILI
jgi:ATP-binding cassette subfamily B protein